MQFLGVKVDEITREQAKRKVAGFLVAPLFKEGARRDRQYKIFTPNPEFVVKAQKDEYFKKVLNSGDLNLCDGMGLALAIRLLKNRNCHPERAFKSDEGSSLGQKSDRDSSPLSRGFGMTKKIERVPGVDFMLEVCQLALEQGKGIYLLGSGNDQVVHKTAEELAKKFSNLKISGYNKGPELDESSTGKFDNPIFEEINKSGAEVLFVAFGMGKQEKWIYENLAKMPDVKVAMGVGGSFDFISGNIQRAPLFLRQLGLEWVYRLIQEPRRIGRIFDATVGFCWLVLKDKFL